MLSIVHVSSSLNFAIVFELVIRGNVIKKHTPKNNNNKNREARLSRFGHTFVRVIANVLFVPCVERSVTEITLRWTKKCDHPVELLNVNVDGNRPLF